MESTGAGPDRPFAAAAHDLHGKLAPLPAAAERLAADLERLDCDQASRLAAEFRTRALVLRALVDALAAAGRRVA